MNGILLSLEPALQKTERSKIVLESTANGFNDFQKLYHRANKGLSKYKSFFFPFFSSAYEKQFAYDIQEATKWYKANNKGQRLGAKDLSKEQKQLYNAGCSLNMLMWREYVLQDKDKNQFYQEYPATDVQAFINTGRSVFDQTKIADVINYVLPSTPKEEILKHENFPDGLKQYIGKGLEIYYFPKPKQRMFAGVDVASGSGNDYSTVSVFGADGQQYASFYRNDIPVYKFAEIVREIGLFFNYAFIVVERNGFGTSVLERLREGGQPYLNLFKMRYFDKGKSRLQLGWNSNSVTKNKAVTDAKEMFECQLVQINCKDTLKQMQTFIEKDNKLEYKSRSNHDDLVISFMLAMQGIKANKYYVLSGLMYSNKEYWFVEEVKKFGNQQRTNEILDIKEYLSGKHKILNKPSYNYNGKVYEPRKIVLQYAKTILNFSIGYVMANPITLTGDKAVTDAFKRIYKRGKYNQIDYDVLDKMTKYGFVAEYVHMDKGQINSKLLDPADCYPVYNHHGDYTSLIEHYCVDNVDYYNVFLPDRVEQYTNEGGDIGLVGNYNNPAGLPIIYHNQDEIGKLGRSDLLDILPILDNIEDLISRATDGYYHYITGIPVLRGEQLKGDGIPKDIVGGGIVLDDNADFFFAQNKFDHQAFETLYKTLTSALLDIAHVPAISMSKTDISNLSEVSIRLLFQLADLKGALNSKFLRQGIEQRFEKIRVLLASQGVKFIDEEFDTLGTVFQFARPSNDKEIVENLKALYEIKGISLETLLEYNPYVNDVRGEMEKIMGNEVN